MNIQPLIDHVYIHIINNSSYLAHLDSNSSIIGTINLLPVQIPAGKTKYIIIKSDSNHMIKQNFKYMIDNAVNPKPHSFEIIVDNTMVNTQIFNMFVNTPPVTSPLDLISVSYSYAKLTKRDNHVVKDYTCKVYIENNKLIH